MTEPAAKGERFLATAGESLWMADLAEILRERLGEAASRVSTVLLPDEVVLGNPAMKGLIPLLGVDMNVTSEKAVRLLGWAPRSREDAIVASAESLIRLGLIGS